MKNRNIEKRYIFIFVILFALSGLLVFQLFNLTIIQGEELKGISDAKRIKEVKTIASRGNIYDRNGELLAGTRQSFAVQLIGDEIRSLNYSDRNDIFLQLIRRLEEDGVYYGEEADLILNAICFKNDKDYYSNKKSPLDLMAERLVEHQLLEELLNSQYIPENKEEFYLSPYLIAVKALDQKGIFLPVQKEKTDKLVFSYKEDGEEDLKLKEKHNLTDNPIADMVDLIDGDIYLVKKLLQHPIVRKIAFELLENKDIAKDLIIVDIALDQDLKQKENKAFLQKNFKKVKGHTDAKSDFVAIAEELVLAELFTKIYDVIPAQLALEELEKINIDPGIRFEVQDDYVELWFIEDRQRNEDAANKLAEILIKENLSEALITDDELKLYIQELILEKGVNPHILVSEWKYLFDKEKEDILENLDLEPNASAKDIFDARYRDYEMDIESDYEATAVQLIHSIAGNIGHLGYEPLNIAHNLSKDTVAFLEETIPAHKGVNIAVVPVRYYPHGTMAAHVLGYVGRIATEEEIEIYNEDSGYSPNGIIGKTGIEESFESVLKGKDGKEIVQVDVLGQRTQTLSQEAPLSGDNVFLSIDFDLQKKAEEALTNTVEGLQIGGTFPSEYGDVQLDYSPNANSASTVVLDVNSGEVLAMANYGAYDPSLFSTGISRSDWDNLFPDDERDQLAHRPLLNIAIQSQIQPGSIFKMITSYAAIEKGMPPEEAVLDSGYMTIGDTDFGCWIWNESQGNHGYINMGTALMHSCNYYYYAMALGENQSTGVPTSIKLDIEDVEEATRAFGLDEPTGVEINIPQEASGKIPNPLEKIETIQALLEDFLDGNLKDFEIQGGRSDERREKDKEIILSWLDENELLTREEVASRLESMGYETEDIPKGQLEPLADTIKYTYINQADWDITDTLNVVIGQGQNAYTPIQMANMVSIIANGGYRNKTTLFNKTMNHSNSSKLDEVEFLSEPIPMKDPNNMAHIRAGMELAGSYGFVGQLYNSLDFNVATKTGTAERAGINPVSGEAYDDYGWFVAYAPAENPQIAVATVIVQGGSGSNAAPMTREIIAEYIGNQNLENEDVEE